MADNNPDPISSFGKAELNFVINNFEKLAPGKKLSIYQALHGKDEEVGKKAGFTLLDLILKADPKSLAAFMNESLGLDLQEWIICEKQESLQNRANHLGSYFRDNLRCGRNNVISIVPLELES